MNRNLIKSLKVAIAAVLFASAGARLAHAQGIIDVDTSAVLNGFINPTTPPLYSPAEEARLRRELAEACREAEAIWEARIVGYSTEVPAAARTLLSTLKIRCEINQIDMPGQILAQAGPDAIASIDRTLGGGRTVNNTLPMEATATFDYHDLGLMSAFGALTSVATHEMGHALGFGFFEYNDLLGPVSAVGIDGYVGGKYAIPAYRRDIGNAFATYIPLQQSAAGAGGHWIQSFEVFDPAIEANRPDLLVPFADFVNPGVFISETTFAVMADFGYAVTGYNERLVAPKAKGVGRWPKITGGLGPFGDGVRFAAADGVSVSRVSGRKHSVYARAESAVTVTVGSPTGTDPYNLRLHRWVEKSK